jgi:release factor glutamine methyltransferase
MGVKIQTIKDIRFLLIRELKDIYDQPEIASLTNIVIKTIMGISRLHQLYSQEKSVSDEQAGKIIEICNELKTGKPIQYILGETLFYDCPIRVDSSTLIPRPETEELVDLIIRENRQYHGSIIDIGTGSGCIAIALAANLPESVVSGIDISDKAIDMARENALLNNVAVSFFQSDIFNFDSDKSEKKGIIVSNPPYVINSEKIYMSKNVLAFEPESALFVPDSNPLVYYNAILQIARDILLPKGKIYFEINETMGQSMLHLLESFGYSLIEIVADINGKERIIKGRKNV